MERRGLSRHLQRPTKKSVTSPTEVAATGWAALKKESRDADAVFLTYDDENGQPIAWAPAQFN
jgi:hypothetical protein